MPSDLSIYADETVKTLKDALLYKEGKIILQIVQVEKLLAYKKLFVNFVTSNGVELVMQDAINKAIEGLVKKPNHKDNKVIEGEEETFVKKSG